MKLCKRDNIMSINVIEKKMYRFKLTLLIICVEPEGEREGGGAQI